LIGIDNLNSIEVRPGDRKNIKKFVDFPFDLYCDIPQWVPPLRSDIRKIFNPKFTFYNYGDTAFFIACDNERVLGRLGVANNHRYNGFHKTKTAFFYYFEAVDDQTVVESLFERGFKWAKNQGLNHILGPKGLTVLDGFGMLVDGFEHQGVFGQPYNLSYFPKLIENLGFQKVKDIYTGHIDADSQFPNKVLRAAELVKKRFDFWSPVFKTKSDLRAVLDDIKKLYNESLAKPSGNPPITDTDLDTMASQLLWIADPKLVKLIYKDNEPIGWMMGYPDVSDAFQKAKGHLFPFGWLRILLESKRTNRIILNGFGIVDDYQRLGATAILYSELYKSVKDDDRYDSAELLQIREENIKSLLETKNFDIRFHKTHRLYEKFI
jgi:hypothetical protein